MFGSPSGPLYDPCGALAGNGTIVEGWLLARLDVHLPIDAPYGDARSTGSVAAILIAPAAEAPLVPVESVNAIAGRGLEGDRYHDGRGTFSGPGRGYQLTLVAAEVLNELGLPWRMRAATLPPVVSTSTPWSGAGSRSARSSASAAGSPSRARTWSGCRSPACCVRSCTVRGCGPTFSAAARSRLTTTWRPSTEALRACQPLVARTAQKMGTAEYSGCWISRSCEARGSSTRSMAKPQSINALM